MWPNEYIFIIVPQSTVHSYSESSKPHNNGREKGGDNSGDEGTHSSGASPRGAKAISGFIPGEFSPRSSLYFVRMCFFHSTCDFLYGEPVRVESCTMSFYNLCIPSLNPLGINIHFLCKLRD